MQLKIINHFAFHFFKWIKIIGLIGMMFQIGGLSRGWTETHNLKQPELSIDFWLNQYQPVTSGKNFDRAQTVFKRLLRIADKPVGTIPRLHIFADLELAQIFALPDGSIILPEKVIHFCFRNKPQGAARLAFLLGHELSHILQADFWILNQIQHFFLDQDIDRPDLSELWRVIQWRALNDSRQAIETRADEFGLLYALLAGYDMQAIISPTNCFIANFYRQARFDLYGDVVTHSVAERRQALLERLNKIQSYLPLFDLGIQLYAIGQYEAAIETLTRFLGQYPSREVYYNLGLCHYQLARFHYTNWQPDSVTTRPDFLLRLSLPIDPAPRFRHREAPGVAESEIAFKKSIEAARIHFEKACQSDENYVPALNSLGCVALLSRELDFVRGYLKKALQLNPDCAHAYNNLGVTHWIAGDVAAAKNALMKATQLAPAYLPPIFNLCLINHHRGYTETAWHYFEHYLQEDSASHFANILRRYFNRATPPVFISEDEEGLAQQWPSEKKGWHFFQTPRAVIGLLENATCGFRHLDYVDKDQSLRIRISQTLNNYTGVTARAIQKGASVDVLARHYPFTHFTVPTIYGHFCVFKTMGLVFEIREHKVSRWFWYDIQQNF